MITKLITLLKQHTPTLYLHIRRQLIGLEMKRRQFVAKRFTSPVIKTLSVHGQTFKLALDPQNGFVDRNIFTNGVYEPDILAVIKKHLRAGSTFVDIGANIGQHALFAAACVGMSGKVIAFEPIPRLTQQIATSLAHNPDLLPRVLVHNLGCSNTTHTADLFISPTNIGGSSMHARRADKITISLAPADTYLENEPRVDFIKIDTEGHELEALEGLTKTITTHHPTLLIEFSPCFRSDTQVDKAILTFLTNHHYRLLDLEAGHQEIKDPIVWLKDFTKRQTNLLCLPHV
jgi:FkbM family methyltransferase